MIERIWIVFNINGKDDIDGLILLWKIDIF